MEVGAGTEPLRRRRVAVGTGSPGKAGGGASEFVERSRNRGLSLGPTNLTDLPENLLEQNFKRAGGKTL